MFFKASGMNSDTLQLMIDFHMVAAIDQVDFFAQIAEWHRLKVPVFAQYHMVVLLYFGPGVMADLIDTLRQFM